MQPPIFNQMDAHRLLVHLERGRVTNNYRDNVRIYRQGELATHVFFVQSGPVKLTVDLDDGRLLGTVIEGQFFGQSCLHQVAVRIATATTVGDCRITSVTKGAIISHMRVEPGAAKLFVDYLSETNRWVDRCMLAHLLEPAAAA
jgi:CRP-like cAMP-binding protein